LPLPAHARVLRQVHRQGHHGRPARGLAAHEEPARRTADEERAMSVRLPAALRGSRLLTLVLVIATLAWMASGFYTVPTTSLAVTRTFGAVVERAVPPGVHWWWPPPVGRVDRTEVTRTLTLS